MLKYRLFSDIFSGPKPMVRLLKNVQTHTSAMVRLYLTWPGWRMVCWEMPFKEVGQLCRLCYPSLH